MFLEGNGNVRRRVPILVDPALLICRVAVSGSAAVLRADITAASRLDLKGRKMEHTDETVSLISAEKVQGTPVYNTQGESLGELEDVMIDKRSGKIAYAVMSFGGFLGVGNDYHPLPWNTLKYDTRQGGYVVGLTKQQLEGAPRFASNDNPAWGNRAYEQSIHDYYKAPPYWAGS
jgi:hypothetical protein